MTTYYTSPLLCVFYLLYAFAKKIKNNIYIFFIFVTPSLDIKTILKGVTIVVKCYTTNLSEELLKTFRLTIEHQKEVSGEGICPSLSVGYIKNCLVPGKKQESQLVEYITASTFILASLLLKSATCIYCMYEVHNDLPIHTNWAERVIAGTNWFSGFLKSHPSLSVRAPEATSLAHANDFNTFNVDQFFNNLEEVMARHLFVPQPISNIDETGITTVHKQATNRWSL